MPRRKWGPGVSPRDSLRSAGSAPGREQGRQDSLPEKISSKPAPGKAAAQELSHRGQRRASHQPSGTRSFPRPLGGPGATCQELPGRPDTLRAGDPKLGQSCPRPQGALQRRGRAHGETGRRGGASRLRTRWGDEVTQNAPFPPLPCCPAPRALDPGQGNPQHGQARRFSLGGQRTRGHSPA